MAALRRRLAVYAVLVLAGLLSPSAQGQPVGPLGADLDRLLENPAHGNAFWGAIVTDLASGEVLYQRHAQKSFLPASNGKLYTAAAVLDRLGPAYRLETRLYAQGVVRDGVLEGPLVVQGRGDPSFGSRYDPLTGDLRDDPDVTAPFRAWSDSLRAQGITTIQGDIIGDDDVHVDQPLGVGWSWDDEPYSYSAEMGGLVFADNGVAVTVQGRTPGAPATVSWTPATTYLEVVNQTRTVDAGARMRDRYARARAQNVLYVSGEVPAGGEDTTVLTVSNPTRYFAHVLRETLLEAGIVVVGRAVDVDDLSIRPDYEAPSMQRVATYTSPPLADLVRVVNKDSQNLYADQLLRILGAALPINDDDLEPGSTAMGVEAAMTTFARAMADTSRLRLVDGSGLSRMNLVTPAMTMAVLRYMGSHPDARTQTAFMDSLPVGGVDGTLERRFRQGPGYQNVRAKTGTLTGVSSLSGYVQTEGGRTLAFVLMANNYTVRASSIRRVQDAIVERLARLSP
ncbi:MAG: D-alanyl-D-alanine carboxypeptidase/D-alanyl-D-alanine-endopeptidase [Bacteroidota bacterium]